MARSMVSARVTLNQHDPLLSNLLEIEKYMPMDKKLVRLVTSENDSGDYSVLSQLFEWYEYDGCNVSNDETQELSNLRNADSSTPIPKCEKKLANFFSRASIGGTHSSLIIFPLYLVLMSQMLNITHQKTEGNKHANHILDRLPCWAPESTSQEQELIVSEDRSGE